MQAEVTKTIATLVPGAGDGTSRAERWRVRGGLAFSGVYLIGVGVLMWHRWDKLISLDLNELGDFFAGAFGPLALLWLVLGYFQQGDELKQNTEALQLQAKELANSVREQRELVDLTNRQLLADMEHRDYEKQLQIQRAQPIFHVKVSHRSNGLSRFEKIIQLLNVGADCVNVVVLFESQQIEILGAGDDSRLPHSERLNITVAIPYPEQGGLPESTFMTVHYVDGNAASQSVRYQVLFFVHDGAPNLSILRI